WKLDHPTTWPPRDPLRTLAFGDISHALRHLFVAGRPIGANGHVVSSIVESNDYVECVAEATRRLALLRGRTG
ncbi:MAG TPA: hypothetical protein VJT73_02295, partial [Polyangiaceae bacterium]|nr:hypothetical protein [Polyangiaceae bacterium]